MFPEHLVELLRHLGTIEVHGESALELHHIFDLGHSDHRDHSHVSDPHTLSSKHCLVCGVQLQWASARHPLPANGLVWTSGVLEALAAHELLHGLHASFEIGILVG